jgi:hypothetical protein
VDNRQVSSACSPPFRGRGDSHLLWTRPGQLADGLGGTALTATLLRRSHVEEYAAFSPASAAAPPPGLLSISWGRRRSLRATSGSCCCQMPCFEGRSYPPSRDILALARSAGSFFSSRRLRSGTGVERLKLALFSRVQTSVGSLLFAPVPSAWYERYQPCPPRVLHMTDHVVSSVQALREGFDSILWSPIHRCCLLSALMWCDVV